MDVAENALDAFEVLLGCSLEDAKALSTAVRGGLGDPVTLEPVTLPLVDGQEELT